MTGKIFSLRQGWGIEWSFGQIGGVGFHHSNWPFRLCLVFCLEQLGIEEWRSWDIRFIRRPNDWEMGVVDEFLRTLGSNLPPTENRDSIRWKLTKNGDFDIRSFYNKLWGPLPIIFLGKVFGRLRLLGVFLSLFGPPYRIRFLQVTICEVEGLILLTSALCVM